MKRPVSLVVLALLLVLPASLHAQTTPDFVPAASPDTLILRIAEGNGFQYLRDEHGLTRNTAFAQVTDGAIPEDSPPSLQRLYGDTGVQDVYVSVTNLVPDGWELSDGGPATTIETRVLLLPDAASAERYIELAFDQQLDQAGELNDGTSEFEAITALPDHDGAIAGWSFLTPFLDLETGEPTTLVPSIRYIAQVGATVASARISTNDAELAGEVAPLLIRAQIACIAADAACESIPLPRESVTGPDQAGEPGTDATPDAAEPLATAVVAVNRANVRSEPNGSSSVLIVVTLGTELSITGESVEADGFTWLPITTPDGTEGWIAGQLVEVP